VTREELRAEIRSRLANAEPYFYRQVDAVVDYVFSNFTEKPRSSAGDQLHNLLNANLDPGWEKGSRAMIIHSLSKELLKLGPQLKDILARHEEEQTRETIAKNGRGFGV
jgi:hypothetical protein